MSHLLLSVHQSSPRIRFWPREQRGMHEMFSRFSRQNRRTDLEKLIEIEFLFRSKFSFFPLLGFVHSLLTH